MNRKAVVFSMFEQGCCNKDIAEKAFCCLGHVRNMRIEFNKLAGVKTHSRKRKLSKPKPGTKFRIAYDFYVANPGASTYKAMKATGLDAGTVCQSYNRYIKGAAA